MNIGAHVSIAKGIDKAPEMAAKWGCEAMQIFTHSPQGGHIPELDAETVKNFKAAVKNTASKPCTSTRLITSTWPPKITGFITVPFRLSAKFGTSQSSGGKIRDDHLGSAKDFGEKESFKKLLAAFEKIFENYGGSAQLLIENSAGAGKIIGSNFIQIGKILKPTYDVGSENRHRKSVLGGVCLDTQHSFASGYDWKNDFENCVKELDKNIGLENVKLMHSNDSATEFNSRKDRHAHIGKGEIGLEGFKKLTAFAQKNGIDMICETAYPGVVEDIKILKEMRGNNEK